MAAQEVMRHVSWLKITGDLWQRCCREVSSTMWALNPIIMKVPFTQAFCDSAEEERQCQLYKEKALVRHWSNLWSGMEIQDTRMNSLKKSCNFITLATFSVIRQCQYSYMRVSLKSEIHALVLLLFHLKCHLYFQDPFQGVNVSERSRLDDTVVHRSQYNSFKEEQPLLSLG